MPEQVGLPTRSRRRTVGLGREEVAQLADVGVTWYTRLEQGRYIHVSQAILSRLASADSDAITGQSIIVDGGVVMA